MENMYTDVRVNLKKVGPNVTSAGHAAFFFLPIKYQIQWVCELVSCFLIRTDRLQDKKGSTIQKEYGE